MEPQATTCPIRNLQDDGVIGRINLRPGTHVALGGALTCGPRLNVLIANPLTSNGLAGYRATITEVGDSLIPDLLGGCRDAVAVVRNSLIANLL